MSSTAGSSIPAMSIKRFKGYRHNIAGGEDVTAFIGRRVALIIDEKGCRETVELCAGNPQATAMFVDNVERLLDLFDEVVTWTPPIPEPLPDGQWRVRVEVAFIPAAGLAHHGRAGVAVGPAFVDSSVNSFIGYLASGSPPNIHHVFGYELTRNYIDPSRFTDFIDYHLQNEPPSSWGFVNQGFINILGCLMMQDTARFSPSCIGFDYFGMDASRFMKSMEDELTTYLTSHAEGTVSFKDAFHSERFPWCKDRSVDNLWSGVIVRLWRDHGKTAFMRGFFKTLYYNLAPRGRRLANKDEHTKAMGNFVLAACFAARADISSWFRDSLHWTLDAGFDDALDSILAAAVADAIDEEEAAKAKAAGAAAGVPVIPTSVAWAPPSSSSSSGAFAGAGPASGCGSQ